MRHIIHLPKNTGERVADAVCSFMGSWAFIITQTVIIVGWITINLLPMLFHFDPMPFILLNLIFSTQAAYASPLILMAQNRQAAKDRVRDDLESEEVDQIFRNNSILLQINQEQIKILNQQTEILNILHARGFIDTSLSRLEGQEGALEKKDESW